MSHVRLASMKAEMAPKLLEPSVELDKLQSLRNKLANDPAIDSCSHLSLFDRLFHTPKVSALRHVNVKGRSYWTKFTEMIGLAPKDAVTAQGR